MALLRRILAEESGATMMEYTVLITLVAIGLIVVVGLFGDNLVNIYQSAADGFAEASDSPPGPPNQPEQSCRARMT